MASATLCPAASAPHSANDMKVASQLLVAVVLLSAQRGFALTDVKLLWPKPRWYNPSVVEYQGSLVSAAKETSFKHQKGKTWWHNKLFMCHGSNSSDIHSMSCSEYDPWKGRRYQECEFDSRVRGGKLDTSGLGDVKVWRWPGKGVFAIFGRKPQRTGSSLLCSGFVVYHQWISMIHQDAEATDTDPWVLRAPLPLLPATITMYPAWQKFAMEKNWMPFVYTDDAGIERLYVTYTVQPHMVFEIMSNGSAVHRWTTHDIHLMAKFSKYDVHGGPPVVFVPGGLTTDGHPYYLGIMHHIERFDNNRIRLYRHFAFKLAPTPPFQLTAVSDELHLTFNSTFKEKTAFIAFVCGLDVSPQGQVYISYGSADIESRLLTMSLQELERHFTGHIAFRDVAVPYVPSSSDPAMLRTRPQLK